jgi:hypothetical protein
METRDDALTSPWSGHLGAVDRALGQCDLNGARRAWENAHLAAVESVGWEGLIEVGRACLRIGGATGGRSAAGPTARRAYFAALYRACRENSFEGILRAAAAFDDLGDREVVEECLGLAELQADGAQTRRRVAAFVERLGLAHTPPKTDHTTGTIGVAKTDGIYTCTTGMP